MKHLPLILVTTVLLGGAPATAQECRTEDEALDRVVWDEENRKASAFRAEIDSTLAHHDIDEDDALIVAFPRPDGSIETLLIDVDVSPEHGRAIDDVVARYVRSRADPDAGAQWDPRASSVPFREHRELCRGRLENRNLVVEELRWIRGELERRQIRPPPRAELDLYTDIRGEVRYARLREETGSEWLDERLLELGRRLRYTPARVNGTPVGAWSRQPFDF